MRVTLNLTSTPGGHLVGTLVSDQHTVPVPFDGWLELMRLLEPAADPAGADDYETGAAENPA